LILRDIDILKEFKNLRVGISINTIDEKFKSDMDKASTIKERLNTLKTLHDNNIYTIAFVSPIFPYISEVSKIIEISKDYIDELSIDLPHGCEYEPEGMYLCSLENIGCVKKFDMSAIDRFRKNAYYRYGEKIAINPVRGIITSRFKRAGELHMVIELQIKIG